MRSYNAVIVGAGPAGAAIALKLAQNAYNVLLVDSNSHWGFRVGEGLPPSAQFLLRDLGVLDAFLIGDHRISYGTVSAWGDSELQPSDFVFQLAGQGYQLDRQRFDAMMRKAACDAGVQFLENTRLVSCERDKEQIWRLHLSEPKGIFQVKCRWLVDAGGRNSRLARSLGSVRTPEDRLAAFYTILQTNLQTDQDGRTFIEACEDGWWYSVLLPAQGRLVIFMTDLDLVNKRELLSINGFGLRLFSTRHISSLYKQHAYVIQQRPRGVDASSKHLQQFAGSNWLAVGDAAMSFDPLSSQGISNALYTGLYAAEMIVKSGCTDLLPQYNRHLSAIYQAYLCYREIYYSNEPRWSNRTFWQRRRGSSTGSA